MNPAFGAIWTANAVLNFEDIVTGIAIEKDQSAVIVIWMNSVEPRVGIIVEALAGASPNFFVSGANVKHALLNDVDEPENIRESSGDLVKKFEGSV